MDSRATEPPVPGRKPAAMDPAEASAMFEDARDAYRRGDYRGALVWLDRLREEFPQDLDIRFARAVALEGLGKLEEAADECDHILEVQEDPEAAALRKRLVKTSPAPTRPTTALAVAGATSYSSPLQVSMNDEIPGGRERAFTPEWTIFVIFICAPFLYAIGAAAYPGVVNGMDVLILHFLAAYVRALIALPVAVLAVYAGLTFLSIHHGRAALDLRNAAGACGTAVALAGIPYAGIPIGVIAGGWIISRMYRMSLRGVIDLAAIAFFVLILSGVLLAFLSLAGTIFVQGVMQFLMYAALA